MNRLNLIERRVSRFLSEPPTVRGAASVIVTATLTRSPAASSKKAARI